LHDLRLAHNLIDHVADEIGVLQEAHTIQLHFNRIRRLPVTITHCTSLTKLTLGHNRLSDVSMEMVHMSNLKHLDICGNSELPFPQKFKGIGKEGNGREFVLYLRSFHKARTTSVLDLRLLRPACLAHHPCRRCSEACGLFVCAAACAPPRIPDSGVPATTRPPQSLTTHHSRLVAHAPPRERLACSAQYMYARRPSCMSAQ
jgi:hypothetical protein